jgi:Cof subfamily protein (haloacid dehalogenase superfamily)
MDTIEILPADIKLIAIDIDGTLLTPDKRITPATREAVRAAQEAGIVVTLATARRYLNTGPIADELGLEIPLILCDGALIIQHPQVEVLHTHELDAQVAQSAVDILVRHGIQPVVHHMMGTVEEMWTGPIEYDNQWLKLYFAAFPEHLYRMPTDTLCAVHRDPLRVVAFSSEELVYGLVPEVTVLPCSWNAIKRGNYGSAEMAILAPDCNKATGVRALAEQLEIPMAQVMAVGDNNNDIEMLQDVGWGVAMGHANDTVKAVAQAVTTSNTEDGVARAIERYALRRAATADSNSFRRETCL